ncbi:hypothetical protein HanIR_Chr11g0555541 [Helianthus annuus]|nr:hypothetical protein HanIR_Chr11g0555541 [Helianthus annuus]
MGRPSTQPESTCFDQLPNPPVLPRLIRCILSHLANLAQCIENCRSNDKYITQKWIRTT